MNLLASLAAALGKKVDEFANAIGVAPEAEDIAVATRFQELATKTTDLEAKLNAVPVVSDTVARQLGIDEVDEKAVHDKIAALGVQLPSVAAALGLPQGSDVLACCNAITAMRKVQARTEAEQLIDEAVAAGRIEPGDKASFLAFASSDLATARALVNSLDVKTGTVTAGRSAGTGAPRALTEAEEEACATLGIPEAVYRAGIDD